MSFMTMLLNRLIAVLLHLLPVLVIIIICGTFLNTVFYNNSFKELFKRLFYLSERLAGWLFMCHYVFHL